MELNFELAIGGRIEFFHGFDQLGGGGWDDVAALDREVARCAHGGSGGGSNITLGQRDEINFWEDGKLRHLRGWIGGQGGGGQEQGEGSESRQEEVLHGKWKAFEMAESIASSSLKRMDRLSTCGKGALLKKNLFSLLRDWMNACRVCA